MNKVLLTGYVGTPPQPKNGYIDMTVATNEVYKNKSGELVTQTDWHNLRAFGFVGDNIYKTIKKGDYVEIEGKNKTFKYVNSDGVSRNYKYVLIDKYKKVISSTKNQELKSQKREEYYEEDESLPF